MDEQIDIELVRRILAKMKADARATHQATGEVDEPAQRVIRKYERLLKAEIRARRSA
jgi:hypothetical protein